MIDPTTNDTVRSGEALLGGTAGIMVAGMTIGQLNEYLQAGAFIVAMISGLCAAFYYLRKATERAK